MTLYDLAAVLERVGELGPARQRIEVAFKSAKRDREQR
jgi:hypothetical protein